MSKKRINKYILGDAKSKFFPLERNCNKQKRKERSTQKEL